MITGYEKPLDILPFDHRHSYITGVFHWQEPLTPDQVDADRRLTIRHSTQGVEIVAPAIRHVCSWLAGRGVPHIPCFFLDYPSRQQLTDFRL